VFEINSYQNSSATIEIEDAIGQKIFGQDVEIVSGKNIIPVKEPLPDGIYFYHIISDNGSAGGKIVVR
jgi:hypothetical protein